MLSKEYCHHCKSVQTHCLKCKKEIKQNKNKTEDTIYYFSCKNYK